MARLSSCPAKWGQVRQPSAVAFSNRFPTKLIQHFILNPKLTAEELLAAACDDLSISYPENASIKTLTDVMNAYLLEAHARDRRTILIIDEAQNLSIEVLEQLRLLTNLRNTPTKAPSNHTARTTRITRYVD